MKKINSFKDLFVILLSDIYVTEILTASELPRLVRKADSEELKNALSHHLVETKYQIKRIEQVFKLLDEAPVRVDWSRDMKTLFGDADKFLGENPSSPLVDAAIIAVAQRLEHFEIATYGTLCEFADCVGNSEVKRLLGETLKEERNADTTLTKIATGGWFRSGVNDEATHNLIKK